MAFYTGDAHYMLTTNFFVGVYLLNNKVCFQSGFQQVAEAHRRKVMGMSPPCSCTDELKNKKTYVPMIIAENLEDITMQDEYRQ